MPRFNFSGIHHVAFATANLDKTIAYWRDLLGFNIIFGMTDKDQKQISFRISQHMMVFFFEWEEVERVKPKRHGEPVKGPFIFDHLAIHMEKESDLFALQDQLVCANFPVSDIINHGFLHSIYTFDPNGIPLEFSWKVPQVDLDKKPVFVTDETTRAEMPALTPNADRWPVCEEDPEDVRVILPGKELKYFQ
ncbi:MAG: VOC family protein [Proteobacteria bacterium]|nr:VOC family protein [Pseudomonadota bacterium]